MKQKLTMASFMSVALQLWPLGEVWAHDIRCGSEQDPNGWAECPIKVIRHEPMRAWSGNKGRLVDVISETGNFKTTVLEGETMCARTWRGSDRSALCGLRDCFESEIYRYSASESPLEKWYGVEHVDLAELVPQSMDSGHGRIAFRLASDVLCGGVSSRFNVCVSSNATVEVIRWGQMIRPDLELKEHVGVDFVSLYHGVVKVDGVYYALGMAMFAREREMWRLEAAVKLQAKSDQRALRLAEKNLTGQRAFGHFFWNFRPLKRRSCTEPTVAHKVDSVEYPDIGPALWKCVESNRVDMLKHLLATGGNPNFKNERNVSLLGRAVGMFAGGNGDAKVIDGLIEHGADPNLRWGTGNSVTPFWSLVQNLSFMGGAKNRDARDERIAVVRKMLRKGADPNLKCGIMQLSALGYAVMRQADMDLIRVLVEGGAEITDKMLEGDVKDETKDYLIGVRNGSVNVLPIVKDIPCTAASTNSPVNGRAQRIRERKERQKAIREEKDPIKRRQMMEEYLRNARQRW